MTEARWQFFVDRGGTFTDCIGKAPRSGALSVVKVPSSDEAPSHSAESDGKSEPMSPSPAAPRMASISACAITSPSE